MYNNVIYLQTHAGKFHVLHSSLYFVAVYRTCRHFAHGMLGMKCKLFATFQVRSITVHHTSHFQEGMRVITRGCISSLIKIKRDSMSVLQEASQMYLWSTTLRNVEVTYSTTVSMVIKKYWNGLENRMSTSCTIYFNLRQTFSHS